MAITISETLVSAWSLPVISGAKNVARVASTIAAPAHKIPLRAVTGELICFRPSINMTAAMKYEAWIMVSMVYPSLPSFLLDLNISNMRSVTT